MLVLTPAFGSNIRGKHEVNMKSSCEHPALAVAAYRIGYVDRTKMEAQEKENEAAQSCEEQEWTMFHRPGWSNRPIKCQRCTGSLQGRFGCQKNACIAVIPARRGRSTAV